MSLNNAGVSFIPTLEDSRVGLGVRLLTSVIEIFPLVSYFSDCCADVVLIL